jgi:hypothetical protein
MLLAELKIDVLADDNLADEPITTYTSLYVLIKRHHTSYIKLLCKTTGEVPSHQWIDIYLLCQSAPLLLTRHLHALFIGV